MADRELDLTFAALADPTRRAILTRLAQGQATVNVLAEPFEISLQSVSRHLKVLEGAGLISRGRNAQFRPCALREEQLRGAASWIAHTRDTWRKEVDQPAGQPDQQPESTRPGPPFATSGHWAR